MPAILVHYTFALSAIPEEDIPFRDVVNLGSQGPDAFMAYGTVPWKKREEVKKIRQWGHTMHALPVESVYLKMMEYADSSPHKDMLYAAEQAKLAFILNVVIDAKKQVIAAFAGDSEKAHVKGCEFVLNLSQVKKNPTDIVITTNGGYPLDQNIYQSVKGMTAAEANCKSGGVIIMVAGLSDGHGGESFCKMVTATSSPQKLLDEFARVPRNETKPDQWEAQILCRILSNYTVIMVTDMCSPEMICGMHMEHAKTFDEALARAFELKGRNATVSLIPDGVSVIVR